MRALQLNEIHEVSGGGTFTDAVSMGGAIGSTAGVAISYIGSGTLAGAAVGGAGFGVIGAALGGAFGAGYAVGSGIYHVYQKMAA